MFYNSQFHQVVIGETTNYIEFGQGQQALIILPGLGGRIISHLWAVTSNRLCVKL